MNLAENLLISSSDDKQIKFEVKKMKFGIVNTALN